jgi:hypothetical protein
MFCVGGAGAKDKQMLKTAGGRVAIITADVII